MREEYHVIEQLDLAGLQLNTVDPNYARFALILTDNVVELMLYRRCKQAIHEDGSMVSYGQRIQVNHPKYDADTRTKALGWIFDEKVKFCWRELSLITEDDQWFINTIHRNYRNAAYHKGIAHNDLIYPIAWQYHDFACGLFQKLSFSARRWTSSNDKISEVVKRHTTTVGIRLAHFEEDIAKATVALRQLKPPISPGFAQQLSLCIIRRVDEFEQALWFLTDQGQRDQFAVLDDILFHNYLFDKSPSKDLLTQPMLPVDFEKLKSEQRALWRSKFGSLPTNRWRDRAYDLNRQTCPMLALKKSETLLSEIEPVMKAVCLAAEEYENQQQLDWDCRNWR